MFEGADLLDLKALGMLSPRRIAPCCHCGSDNRYEMRFACRVRDRTVYGCCPASLSETPGINPERIMKSAPSFLQD